MNITVGTTALPLPSPFGAPTIQNLGPGVIYFDRDDTVLPQTGIRIEVGSTYTVPNQGQFGRGGGPRGFDSGPVWVISDIDNTDVRFFI